jgi:hypothetical protein
VNVRPVWAGGGVLARSAPRLAFGDARVGVYSIHLAPARLAERVQMLLSLSRFFFLFSFSFDVLEGEGNVSGARMHYPSRRRQREKKKEGFLPRFRFLFRVPAAPSRKEERRRASALTRVVPRGLCSPICMGLREPILGVVLCFRLAMRGWPGEDGVASCVFPTGGRMETLTGFLIGAVRETPGCLTAAGPPSFNIAVGAIGRVLVRASSIASFLPFSDRRGYERGTWPRFAGYMRGFGVVSAYERTIAVRNSACARVARFRPGRRVRAYVWMGTPVLVW